MAPTSLIQQAGEGNRLLALSDLLTIKVPQAANGGHYAVFEETVPPLGDPPPHTHPNEEVFFVVQGKFDVCCTRSPT